MRYYEIPQDTFEGLVTESGLLLSNFNIEAAVSDPTAKGFTNEDIIGATTGGIQVNLTPTYSDLGEDVDNCPLNMMELKHLDSWAASIGATMLSVASKVLKYTIGAADIDSDGQKVTPRMSVKLTDFQTIWWVSDKANGGFVAAKLTNGLSTDGLSLQTGKNTKGQTTLTITGHVSLQAQNVVPLVFYSVDPDETVTYSVTQTLTHITSDFTDDSVEAGSAFEATLTAESGYSIDSVTVTMDGTDITSTAWSSTTGKVSIEQVTGDIVITGTATE